MTGRIDVLYVGTGGEESAEPSVHLNEALDGSASVSAVPSARSAVRRIEAARPDCLVAEEDLPETTGVALLRAVRERWSALPVALFPRDGSERLAADAVAAGVTEYVPREGGPGDFERLAARIDRVVSEADTGGRSGGDQYERLFEHAPVMYVVTHERDGQPVIEDCNRRFCDRLGYRRDDLLGRPLAAIYTEESTEKLLSGGGYDRAKGGAFSPETRHLQAADGEVVETLLHAAPRTDDGGGVTGTLSLYVDVTQRRRSEERLELFRSLLDESNDSVFVVDPETAEFVDVNRTACRRLGYDRETLLGMTVPEVSTGFSGPDEWQDHVGRLAEEGPVLREVEHVRADGSRFPVEINVGVAALDREYVVAIARDISERKRQQRRFRALTEHSTDLITVVDPDGTIQYQSPSVERVLGYDAGTVTGENLFSYVHPEDREEARNTVANTDDRPRSVVVRMRHADGSWRVLETLTNNQLGNDAVGGFVLNSRDVTERTDRERQLAVVDRVLRHNLRNDMDVVIGYAEEIQQLSEGDVATLAETVSQQGLSLLDTIEKEREIVDVLMEGIDREIVDAAGAVAGAVADVRERYPGVDVTTDLPDDATVVASTDRLAQAFFELVENAISHADHDSPTVAVRAEADDHAVRVRVVDDGPGIPDHEVDVLTRDRDIAPLYHGSGLGLWLVNWIVRRSGGSLSFHCRDPRGSVVTVELPRPRSDASDPRPVTSPDRSR